MDREPQCFEPGLAPSVAALPPRGPYAARRASRSIVALVIVPAVAGCRLEPDGLLAPGRTRARGRSSMKPHERLGLLLHARPESGRLHPAAVGHLHQVLVSDELARVLEHSGKGHVSGLGPSFDAPQVGRLEYPSEPEGEKRLRVLDRRPERFGIGPGQLARVAPCGKRGDRHVHLVLAFPL